MKSQKANKIFKIIMLVLLTAFITFIITVPLVYTYLTSNNTFLSKNINTEVEVSDNSLEQTLANFKYMLEQRYIEDFDEQDLIEGAMEGYISGLKDPYTEYLTPEEMKTLTEETEGEYVGVGVYITNNTITNEIMILRTIGNSPAYKAGLLTGDVIKEINGTTYTGEQLNEASDNLRGEVGTEVKIKILRNNEELEISIVREKIKLSCVSSNQYKNIGYLKISSFDGGCADEFYEKYKELEKNGIESLIIDLRFNGGGLVEESLEIGELLVEKDKILLITKSKNQEEVITKSKGDKKINMPVVVLVNEYSASASEILTGILQEVGGATVIGKTTYGKGVIQTVYQLSNGGGLKITTDEYFTPNHNKINEIGINPDIEVELPEEWQYTLEIEYEYDTQLQKAIEELSK